MMKERKTILEAQEVHTFYGLSHILFGVSLEVREGEIVAILGRNGAGKTTFLRSVAGLTPAKRGRIYFLGDEITGEPGYIIARKGIGSAFNEKRVFGNLTVRENIELGARKPLTEGFKPWNLERIYHLFPFLRDVERRWGKNLSGGQQQMVCIAKALMGNPKLLLLDEPTTGLSPLVVEMIGEHVSQLKEEKVTVLLAEQDVEFAMELADRCYIIDSGELRFQGSIDELKKNEEIVKKYLAV